ncbi:Mrp family chromosome partitioning ATPase [Litorimonas taeanensis]|uniref:Mrp family chromosome partitioning ATPase n=1 Tax=Litorimonas taeanensis TaxID=568099 RepID=A0A420WLK9_9PROT|nr:tyrosine-protein kinase family protein [Litorimonas taeanensis]RKQ71907.1 Mrp family chromosome partitioning ATPase [Litorimonas taeanensis]
MDNRTNPSSQAASSVLKQVLQGIQSSPRPDGLGKIIQVCAANPKMGTSFVARNLAELAAANSGYDEKRVGLFDCDLQQQDQTGFFFAPHRAVDMQGPYDVRFGGSGFWAVQTPTGQYKDMPNLCGIFINAKSGLAFTTLFWDQLQAGDQLQFFVNDAYWMHLRSQFSYIFVDMPAFDRSQDCLALAPHCDGTIIVALADEAEDPLHRQMRDRIIQTGGRYEGLILNGGSPIQALKGAG